MKLKDKIIYWRRLSNYDLKTANALYEKRQYPYTLYFLHLSTEKLLKAVFLSQKKKDTPRTHNLIYLAQNCNIELEEKYWNLLAELNEFNLESRYPEYKMSLYKIATKKYTLNYLNNTKEIIKCLKKKLSILLKSI